jgi:hypothetical protein
LDPIKILNNAVKKIERGDVALRKTLVNYDYEERMRINKKYEEVYETVIYSN